MSWNYPAPWGAPLGHVQATQNADMSQWLVPICAVTETTADQWNAVKRGAKIVKIEVKPKMPYATRFAALACNEEDHIGFPDIATATKTATTNTRMPKWMDKRTQKDKKKKAADEFGAEKQAGQAAAVWKPAAVLPNSPREAVVSVAALFSTLTSLQAKHQGHEGLADL